MKSRVCDHGNGGGGVELWCQTGYISDW